MTEFIEHYNWQDKFTTDIWYVPGLGKFKSVVTDLDNPKGFTTLTKIREAIKTFMEVSTNE